jgi:peroxiredoxin
VSVVEYRGGIPLSAEVGERAPGFTLPTRAWNETVSLDDLVSDGPVVLNFYPGDRSSVCTGQLPQLQERISRFRGPGASAKAISADTPWSHPERAYFVIDGEGTVRAKKIEESTGGQPELDEVLRDLEEAL